jgi:PAS domain S-box-containing protein
MMSSLSGRGLAAKRYWWPFLAFALLATPLIATWELFRADRQDVHTLRLLTMLGVFEALAATILLYEYLEIRQLFRDARKSEERLRLAVQAGKMYVDEWNLSTNTIIRSPECEDVLGTDQPLQTTLQQCLPKIHPDDQTQVEHFIESITPDHPTSHIVYRFLRSSGEVIWLERSVRGLFDRNRRLVRLIGVVVDITDRKEADEALRASEERFRRVVENIADAVVIDDRSGKILFASDRFVDLFGFSREQLEQLCLEDCLAPEYRAEARDRHERRMRGESVETHLEYEGLRTDGRRMWLEVDVVPVMNSSAELLGTQCSLRDVTERKRTAQALEESEQRFRLVANTAPVMIWVSGPDKLCNYFNQQWLDFTGRPLEAELGNGWADNVHSEDVSACLNTFSQAFAKREPFDMQYRMRRHDGEYRWVYNRGVPRFNPDGAFAGYIGSCYDITDRKLAEETLASLGRRLIEAHEEERTWIARELHDDINQRLALLAVELERWSQHIFESTSDIRFHIEAARERLFNIAKDVQKLSHRLHSSKLEYLGLTTAAKSICREFSGQQGVYVEFNHSNIPAELPNEISLALYRVLQEALQNAVKHSHAQKIKVDLHGDKQQVELTVSDLGAGFDPSRAMTGRGLGLISMRERIHLVNGSFAIDSKPGCGTSIRARIPFAQRSERFSAAG